jgi:hypothetical protein
MAATLFSMTNPMRIRIAAITTALFIVALSAGGLAVRSTPQASGPAAAAPPSGERAVNATHDAHGEDGEGWEIDDD